MWDNWEGREVRSKLPSSKEGIRYIESTGWEFIGYSFGAYWFKGSNGKRVANGNNKVAFTLTELRHAFNYGW